MLNLDDRIILTPKGILPACPKCGGRLRWNGEDTVCQCGYVHYDFILPREVADHEILTEDCQGNRKRGVERRYTQAEISARYRARRKLGLVGV